MWAGFQALHFFGNPNLTYTFVEILVKIEKKIHFESYFINKLHYPRMIRLLITK